MFGTKITNVALNTPFKIFLSPTDRARGEREFPFPVIPGNTSLKFPVPSLPVAFCNFPFSGKGSFGRESEREMLSLFAVLRMAGQGIKMNKILNLTLLFI